MSDFSTAYIGLGSNLDNPSEQIHQALDAIANIPQTENLCCAPWYRSKAIGPGEQPDYINTVARITTRLTPEVLLKALQAIENQQGRQRHIRWGARTLDLDLLLFDQQEHHSEDLQLPHPEMHKRAFVLLPLADLAPGLQLPDGSTVNQHLYRCDSSDLQPITPLSQATGND